MPDAVAFVGRSESITPFSGIGCTCIAVDNADAARREVKELARKGWQLVFVEDWLANALEEVFVEFSERPAPALSVFPGLRGPTPDVADRLRAVVRLTVGVDIVPEETDTSSGQQKPNDSTSGTSA